VKKILLLEDNIELSLTLVDLLELSGYNVFLAKNGQEALDRIGDFNPDVIVSDIKMPVMDGSVFLQTLRNDGAFRKIPFIFISAYADSESIRQSINDGADDFISKPFTIKQLIDTIESRLARFSEVQSKIEFDLINKFEHILSPREIELLLLVYNGLSTKEISKKLEINERTVQNHKLRILDKLNPGGGKTLTQLLLLFLSKS